MDKKSDDSYIPFRLRSRMPPVMSKEKSVCNDGFIDNTKPTSHELNNVLTRWEGAVSACERDGDDSPEAEKELSESRKALLDVLRRALGCCDDK